MFEKCNLFANQTKLTTWRKITREFFFKHQLFCNPNILTTQTNKPTQPKMIQRTREKRKRSHTNIVSLQTKSFGPRLKKNKKNKKR
jgi:hypothetical protein